MTQLKKYSGRLFVEGGHLRADQRELVGYRTVDLHDQDGAPILDGNGQKTYLNIPMFRDGPDHGKPVAFDSETDSYIFIEEGAPSHNDRHHKRFAEVSATSETLYDAQGKVVYEGDPHHKEPTPDDPHYDETAPNKTSPQTDPDNPGSHKSRKIPTNETFNLRVEQHEHEIESGDPTLTGHTDAEAYRVR